MRAWLLVAVLLPTACGGMTAHIRQGLAKDECPLHPRGMTIATDGNAPCDMLYEDVEYATEVGAAFGLWPETVNWGDDSHDVHLQAVKPSPLPPADVTGYEGAAFIGITTWGNGNGIQMLITTGLGRTAFRSTLVHELLHAWKQQGGHCHWAHLAGLFMLLQDQGAYEDDCQQPKVYCMDYGEGFECRPLP